MKKILLVASGGDAPGINDFIAYLVKNSSSEYEYYYGKYGLKGILENNIYKLKVNEVNNLFDIHSSIIKCGRLPEFETDNKIREKIAFNIKDNFDNLIILGGNGTQKAAKILATDFGINTIFVPLTIDNDVANTTATLGYYTSLEIVTNLVNNASYSINAHGNALIVEVMGRKCNDLINNAYNLSNAHYKILDNNLDPKKFANDASNIHQKEGHVIVLVREKLSKYTIKDYADALANKGISVRPIILGHLQRGGKTSIYDKLLGYEMANEVIKNIKMNSSIFIVKQDGKVQSLEIIKK